MKCARHPDIETNLRCGKCGQPICPKCLVQTPVGARCPDCAAVRRLPLYRVPMSYYARAIGAGFATGAALGAVWSFIPVGGFFLLIFAAGIGYAIGEVISLAVNRKRGPWLQVVASLSMVTSYLVRTLIEAPPAAFLDSLLSVYGLVGLALGVIVAASTLRRN